VVLQFSVCKWHVLVQFYRTNIPYRNVTLKSETNGCLGIASSAMDAHASPGRRKKFGGIIYRGKL